MWSLQTYFCILTILITGAWVVQCTFTIADEEQLRNDTFSSYTNTVRPSPTTSISLQISLTSIDTVDIKNQVFGITGWWSMRWDDARLSWNMATYGNIPILQCYPDIVWTPCLVVDNSVTSLGAIEEDSIPLRIKSDGSVVWNPPAIQSVSCEMDITYFPFDTQTCAIQVTSFGYSVQEVDILVYGSGIDQNYYEPNGQWDLVSVTSQRTTYTEDSYEYSKVYYYFEVKRKTLFYGLNLILPILVNAFLCVFVFLLPADSGEKIGYCLTVLLAFMVLLTLIAVDLPQTAKYTSILEVYIALVLILMCLSVVFSIIILYIHHLPEKKKKSKTVKRLTILAMYICCVNPKKAKVSPKDSDSSSGGSSSDSSGSEDEKRPTTVSDPLGDNQSHLYKPNFNSSRPISNKRTLKQMNQSQFNGVFGVNRNSPPRKSPEKEKEKKKKKKKKKKSKITWPFVAGLVDGVLFRVYGFIILVASTVVMVLLVLGD